MKFLASKEGRSWQRLFENHWVGLWPCYQAGPQRHISGAPIPCCEVVMEKHIIKAWLGMAQLKQTNPGPWKNPTCGCNPSRSKHEEIEPFTCSLSGYVSPLPDSGPLAFLLAAAPHHMGPGTQTMTHKGRLQDLKWQDTIQHNLINGADQPENIPVIKYEIWLWLALGFRFNM